MENKGIDKFANSKVLLFLLPHMVYFAAFMRCYNVQNFDNYYSVLMYELLLIIGIYFVFTLLLQLFFNKVCKNKQVTAIALCIIARFYKRDLLLVFIGSLIFLILTIFIKKGSNVFLNFFVYFFTIYFGVMFIGNSGLVIYNYITLCVKTDNSVVNFSPIMDETKPNPNIYYIHCDGMINLDDLEKYFGSSSDELEEYFLSLGFMVNNKASFVGGHTTLKSLTALFNPYYYDNKEKYYLDELEQYYLKKNNKYSKYISYKELSEKRYNSELLVALKNKGYTTYSYAPYTQNTALNTDNKYDYDEMTSLRGEENELKYIDFKNEKQNNRYLFFERFNNIAMYSSLEVFNIKDKFLKAKNIDINYEILSSTPNIANSTSYTSKAIMTVLNDSFKEENKKFVFVDYDLNHLPVTYDKDGNVIAQNDLEYFVDNYIYTSYFLMEIVNYIKSNDENAIIIAQADHGIHLLDDDEIMDYLDISLEDVMNLRNSTFSAIYIPDKYKNGDEMYLTNPLNISRYLVNNFVGDNYEYLKVD